MSDLTEERLRDALRGLDAVPVEGAAAAVEAVRARAARQARTRRRWEASVIAVGVFAAGAGGLWAWSASDTGRPAGQVVVTPSGEPAASAPTTATGTALPPVTGTTGSDQGDTSTATAVPPIAGTSTPPATDDRPAIHTEIAAAPGYVVVPDVIGLGPNEATRAVAAAVLTPRASATTTTCTDDDVGTVVAQEPAVGTSVLVASHVDLTVCLAAGETVGVGDALDPRRSVTVGRPLADPPGAMETVTVRVPDIFAAREARTIQVLEDDELVATLPLPSPWFGYDDSRPIQGGDLTGDGENDFLVPYLAQGPIAVVVTRDGGTWHLAPFARLDGTSTPDDVYSGLEPWIELGGRLQIRYRSCDPSCAEGLTEHRPWVYVDGVFVPAS